MGGYGSGKWHRWDAKNGTTDSSLPLDVRNLARKGLLKAGSSFTQRWSRGLSSNAITGYSMGDEVVLLYKQRHGDGEWEPVEQRLPLTWTPCNYGGERPWWYCPSCGRRVAVVYGAGKLFACRHCHQLTHGSSRESHSDRSLRKAQKIREQLGGGPSLMEPFPERPTGMHHTTYWRLFTEYREAERASLAELAARLEGMESRTARLLAKLHP
jgi:hypothetical protein